MLTKHRGVLYQDLIGSYEASSVPSFLSVGQDFVLPGLQLAYTFFFFTLEVINLELREIKPRIQSGEEIVAKC